MLVEVLSSGGRVRHPAHEGKVVLGRGLGDPGKKVKFGRVQLNGPRPTAKRRVLHHRFLIASPVTGPQPVAKKFI